jgi:hypothetical protein
MVPPAAVPPCCASCGAYDREDRVCRLLAEPSLPNRRAILTMPCRPERLLQIRFRAHGPDVARDALVTWLDPEWDPDDITLAYGRAPRDARLFLGGFPYLYLARSAVRRAQRDGARYAPADPLDRDPAADARPSDPTVPARVTRALAEVRRIDPVGHAMLLDFLRDSFDAQGWATTLGWAAASVTDRKYLSVYRYAVSFHDVLVSIPSREMRVALVARRLSPGEPSEHAALEQTRAELGAPLLTMTEWRRLYREGALASLAALAAPDALGEDTMSELGTAFRRVLRLDVGPR